jgi:hypothetical protein
MTLAQLFALENLVLGSTNAPVDHARAVMALTWARQAGCYDQVMRLLMNKRREHRIWLTRVQRDWQTKVSRRPARGRHHDSWSIREKYVRCAR